MQGKRKYNDSAWHEHERERNNKHYAAMTLEQKLNRGYKRQYKITYAEALAMLEQQGNRCKACGDPIKLGFNNGVIDHCHASKKIRGVLCSHCNRALGFVKDDIQRLENLISYLKETVNG